LQKIIIGYDHLVNRTAGITDLKGIGLKKYGFEVEQISAEEINEISISSPKLEKQ
jgi:riboflavin kinase/FMN adenylyltransferase